MNLVAKACKVHVPRSVHYKGPYVGIACSKSATEKAYITSNVDEITCEQCKLNHNSVKVNIAARKLSENPDLHGTLFGYLEASCRCFKCNLFWSRHAAIEKYKHKLAREYNQPVQKVVEFLNRKISEDSATCFVDVLIEDTAFFRSLALSNLGDF